MTPSTTPFRYTFSALIPSVFSDDPVHDTVQIYVLSIDSISDSGMVRNQWISPYDIFWTWHMPVVENLHMHVQQNFTHQNTRTIDMRHTEGILNIMCSTVLTLFFIKLWQVILILLNHMAFKRKRKKSNSVLWQKLLHPQKYSKSKKTTQNATKNFDYTTIADRPRTISWSNDSHPFTWSPPSH